MMRHLNALSVIFLLFSALSSTAFSDTNVALDQTVTLNGSFFTGGSGGGMVVPESTIVDNVFLTISHPWDQGSVWWDQGAVWWQSQPGQPSGQYITIGLSGVYLIDSFIVQADDNDAYILSYWDLSSSSWMTGWDVPLVGGRGMQTRPNPLDNNERYYLGTPIITNALKFEGNITDSDLLFAVSEIQAFGTPVPEPTTILLLGSGLIGLAGYGRKKFFKK